MISNGKSGSGNIIVAARDQLNIFKVSAGIWLRATKTDRFDPIY
jgi:hypothetical protein